MTPDKKADRKTRKRRHRKEAGGGCKCPSLFEDPRLEIGPPEEGDRRCEAQRGGEMIAVVS